MTEDDGSGVWWQCSGCFREQECAPCGHTDYGGVIVVYGPHCEECDGIPMDFLREDGR